MRSAGQASRLELKQSQAGLLLTLSSVTCRKALLQTEGYQKSQLARAAIQHGVTQAAEADHAVIEEVSKSEAAHQAFTLLCMA